MFHKKKKYVSLSLEPYDVNKDGQRQFGISDSGGEVSVYLFILLYCSFFVCLAF